MDPARDEKNNQMYNNDYHSPKKDKREDKDTDNNQELGEWYDIPCCEKHEHKEYEVYTPVSVKPYVHAHKPEAKEWLLANGAE